MMLLLGTSLVPTNPPTVSKVGQAAQAQLDTLMRRLASDGLGTWKQVVERGYEGYVAKDERSA
jgi:hypothetical protein